MLNYNHLFYFHAVATAGSVSAAATQLGVTQPTVSEQIRTLERTLAVRLFERELTGWKLTEAGRLTFEQTSVMFRAGERIVESLGHSPDRAPRSLRVGITAAVSRTTTSDLLMPLFAMNQCLPAIKSGDAVELLRELRASELDLVVAESTPPEASRGGFEVELIDATVLTAVAAPSVKPDETWRNVTMIHYRSASAFRWDVEAYLETNGLHPTIAGEADDPTLLLEVATRSTHVVFVPRSVARHVVRDNRLAVLAQVEPSHAGVYAVFPDGQSAGLAREAVQLLVKAVRAA